MFRHWLNWSNEMQRGLSEVTDLRTEEDKEGREACCRFFCSVLKNE